MTKNTINQICDKLTTLADNCAEQERTLRGLIAIIRASKDEKPDVINTIPDDKLSVIEQLLRELKEKGSDDKKPDRFPFDTHPTPWWMNQPQCLIQSTHPELWQAGQPFSPFGSTISVVPCSSPSEQQIIYADSRGIHITGKETK